VNKAQDKIFGLGQVGFFVAEPLEAIYREIAGLLGVSFNEVLLDNVRPPELPDYKAIIVDGISLTYLKRFMPDYSGKSQDVPLILVCGPVSGESSGLRLKTFPFNLGVEGTRLLMEGREYTEVDIGKPILDLMLEEIRAVLRREVTNYLELPPIPWGYSYAMALTHDIDILSLKEMPIARTFLGYFYRSSVLNWKRWRAGKVRTAEFVRTIWEMAKTWAAKVGIGQDVWQRALPSLLALEERLGVRSSLYFMPFAKKPGILPEQLRKNEDEDSRIDCFYDKDHDKDRDRDKHRDKDYDKDRSKDSNKKNRELVSENAPANRASYYDVSKHQELLNRLEEGGWEVGVHGIDAWHDVPAARAEHGRLAGLTGRSDIGARIHWLYFKSPQSYKIMEEGGFYYDATVGFNEVVGFRAGTLQPYHPLNCQTMWELPLHIQDGALLGEEHLDLNREEAFQKAKPILDFAKRFGGAVSLLWHNQSFTAPRFWGGVYERLIAQGRKDGAWIAVPRDVLRWFNLRRQCTATLTIEGTCWQIRCAFPDPDQERDLKRDTKHDTKRDTKHDTKCNTKRDTKCYTKCDMHNYAVTEKCNSRTKSLLQAEKCNNRTVPLLHSSVPAVRVRLYVAPERVKSASVPYEAGEGYIDFPAQGLVTLEVEGED
jgi:hypothetical protein